MASENTNDYLSVLNEEQLEAVRHTGGPLLILAGAGSGKTRVITTKIAYLIRESGVKAWNILAVTFTRKAADEMRERAVGIDGRAANTQIRTFHSFGAWFLRANAEAARLNPNFTVYDDEDSATLIRKALPKLTKQRSGHFAHLISLAKDYCLTPESDELDEIDSDKELREVYRIYQQRLRETGNVDFGDLIMLPYLILRNDEEIRRRMHEKFRVILVDEYQDSNSAQFQLLRELSGVNENSGTYVCVVGDDDQSIYKFRGADVNNILDFEKHFPGTKIIRLEKNYRSKAEILKVADDVVKNNTGRLGKKLEAMRGSGPKPLVAFLRNQNEEAEECAGLIRKSVREGGKYSDWAILYRTNAQSLNFETVFMQKEIPYRVVGSLKFYEREEVKDILAYVSLVANPRDEISFRRVANKPARGIGQTSQDKIVEFARASLLLDAETEQYSMDVDFLAATKILSKNFPKKAREGAAAFLDAVEAFRRTLGIASEEDVEQKEAARGLQFGENDSEEDAGRKSEERKKAGNLSDFIYEIIERSGLKEHYESEDEISGTQKTDNMYELMNSAAPFECSQKGLLEFLDHIQLDSPDSEDGAEDRNKVSLITLHNTKGLEFRNVVMTGMEYGVFPNRNKAGEDLEEERRLCYVGMTRAMDALYMTSCSARMLYGHLEYMDMSPFLREIDPDSIRVVCSKGQEQKKRQLLSKVYGKNGLSAPDGAGDEISHTFRVGRTVSHDDWGFGEIVAGEFSESGEWKITVDFGGARKNFIPKYIRHHIEVVAD